MCIRDSHYDAHTNQSSRLAQHQLVYRALLRAQRHPYPLSLIHISGTKKVLGKKFKEKGEEEGRQLLHMLASNPATARFLSRKIAIRFVGDDPPQALVDRLAKSYMSSGGDISKVLGTLSVSYTHLPLSLKS